jgi:hypothetical protein
VGIGVTELVVTLFGLAGQPPLIKLRRPRRGSVFLLVFLLLAMAGAGCSSVSSRIRDHEGEFATYPPQAQAQIQNGRIDKGFTEDMVTIALGEPAEKTAETESGKRFVVWKYTRPATLQSTTASQGSMSAPYGYPGPATGPAQPIPMFYERQYYKVKFEAGRVVDVGLPDGPALALVLSKQRNKERPNVFEQASQSDPHRPDGRRGRRPDHEVCPRRRSGPEG